MWALLFVQGGFFYVPYWLWKVCDRGRIKLLVSDLNLKVLSDEDHVAKEKAAILRYFAPNRGHHTLYAMQYIGLELLQFGNVLVHFHCPHPPLPSIKIDRIKITNPTAILNELCKNLAYGYGDLRMDITANSISYAM